MSRKVYVDSRSGKTICQDCYDNHVTNEDRYSEEKEPLDYLYCEICLEEIDYAEE